MQYAGSPTYSPSTLCPFTLTPVSKVMLTKLTVIVAVAVAMNRTGHRNADYFKYAGLLQFIFNNAVRSFLAQHHTLKTICSQSTKN